MKVIISSQVIRIVAYPTRKSIYWVHLVYGNYNYWKHCYLEGKFSEKEMIKKLDIDEYYLNGDVYIKPTICIIFGDGNYTEKYYNSDEDMKKALKSFEEENSNVYIYESFYQYL